MLELFASAILGLGICFFIDFRTQPKKEWLNELRKIQK